MQRCSRDHGEKENQMKKPRNKEIELKHLLCSHSSCVSQEFPDIKSIDIRIKFTNPDDGSEFIKNITYQPNSKAYFQYPCPYGECVNGGYDLKNVIERAVKYPDKQAREKLTCNGWQDAERVGKHRCLLEALIEVKVVAR